MFHQFSVGVNLWLVFRYAKPDAVSDYEKTSHVSVCERFVRFCRATQNHLMCVCVCSTRWKMTLTLKFRWCFVLFSSPDEPNPAALGFGSHDVQPQLMLC